MSKPTERKKEALELIDQLFGDTSVSKKETLDALEDIQSEVDSKIDALRADIKHEERAAEGGGA